MTHMTIPAPSKELVEQYLREQFKKPRPSWIMRLLGEPLDWNYSVGVLIDPIEHVDTGNLLRRHRIFRVYVEDSILQQNMLPGCSTFGLFSFDGSKLTSLSRDSPQTLETLLRIEESSLEHSDPRLIASLLTEIFLDVGVDSHAILPTLDSLLHFGIGDDFGGGYRLNDRELEQVRNDFSPISLKGSRECGWSISFSSVYGWMHEKNELGIQRFDITGDYKISRHRKVLSQKIFAQTPALIY